MSDIVTVEEALAARDAWRARAEKAERWEKECAPSFARMADNQCDIQERADVAEKENATLRAQLAETERRLTASLAAESLVSTRLAAAEASKERLWSEMWDGTHDAYCAGGCGRLTANGFCRDCMVHGGVNAYDRLELAKGFLAEYVHRDVVMRVAERVREACGDWVSDNARDASANEMKLHVDLASIVAGAK